MNNMPVSNMARKMLTREELTQIARDALDVAGKYRERLKNEENPEYDALWFGLDAAFLKSDTFGKAILPYDIGDQESRMKFTTLAAQKVYIMLGGDMSGVSVRHVAKGIGLAIYEITS